MARFADLRVSEFLDALASTEPTPGGGTAAAVVGAVGVSLLMMVAGLPRPRGGTEAALVQLAEARAKLTGIRERLAALADEDSAAFNQVMSAYRRTRTTEEEKAARTAAIQSALKLATGTPLDTLRAVAEAMRIAIVVAQLGNRTAASDARVGVSLLAAAADGAAANVRINLDSVQDEAFTTASGQEVETLERQVANDAGAARKALET